MSRPVTDADPEGSASVASTEWQPYEVEQHSEHASALPVRMVKDPTETESHAADHSSFTTFVLVGSEAPFPLLAFDRKRSKATVIVSPNAAGTQFVRLAKQEQVSNNGGALVPSGNTITYSAAPQVWCIPQPASGAVVITIVEERYA